jgi:hypothetical protein
MEKQRKIPQKWHRVLKIETIYQEKSDDAQCIFSFSWFHLISRRFYAAAHDSKGNLSTIMMKKSLINEIDIDFDFDGRKSEGTKLYFPFEDFPHSRSLPASHFRHNNGHESISSD